MQNFWGGMSILLRSLCVIRLGRSLRERIINKICSRRGGRLRQGRIYPLICGCVGDCVKFGRSLNPPTPAQLSHALLATPKTCRPAYMDVWGDCAEQESPMINYHHKR